MQSWSRGFSLFYWIFRAVVPWTLIYVFLYCKVSSSSWNKQSIILWHLPLLFQRGKRGISRAVPSAPHPAWTHTAQAFKHLLIHSKRNTRLTFIALVYHQWNEATGRDFPFDFVTDQLALLGGPQATNLKEPNSPPPFCPPELVGFVWEVHPRFEACFILCILELWSAIPHNIIGVLHTTARDEGEQCALTRRRFAMLATCDISGLQNRQLPRAHSYHGQLSQNGPFSWRTLISEIWFAFLTDELASISTLPCCRTETHWINFLCYAVFLPCDFWYASI